MVSNFFCHAGSVSVRQFPHVNNRLIRILEEIRHMINPQIDYTLIHQGLFWSTIVKHIRMILIGNCIIPATETRLLPYILKSPAYLPPLLSS